MATNHHRHFCFSCCSSSAEAGSSQRDDFAASSSNQTQPALSKIIQKEDIAASSSSNQTQPALRKIIRKEDIAASSSNQTQPALREIIQKKDIDEVGGKFVVDTPKLIQHISELLELREKEKRLHEQPSKVSSFFEWSSVPGFNKLKEILSLGTDFTKLAELLNWGLDLVSALKEFISGPVKTVLTDIGKASVATAGLLLVAYTLEGLDNLSSNQEECWIILEQMNFVATVVEKLKASPEVIQDLIEPATILIAEGAIMCCSKMDSSPWKKFFLSQKIKQDLSDIRKRLSEMYMQINIEIGFRILTAIESKGRSPLSKVYPTHAVGLKEPVEEVLRLLKIESDDQNAVTVILHGFGGMGKTTLADAVVSKVGGCKYSKVRLPVDINPSNDVIVKLQKHILEDLMEPGQSIRKIRAHEDGRRELEAVLKKVHAFIYIDNVLEPAALEKLLPEDLTEAKKVRILLTARDVNVKNACPRPCTKPAIYSMKRMKDEEAMIILQKEIKEGISESQFKEILGICGGNPLKLSLAAAMIGRADVKQRAYAELMYPTHAVGIEKPIERVFSHLEIQSDDQNAVTVILHGFGGMGKTTLADAVFSEIGGRGMVKTTLDDAKFWKDKGGKRSKVRLFDSIKSTPDITALQKQILEDLMEPGETIPEISTHKDGQRALEGVLRKIHAFIYIDNVLEAAALEELLPQDMTTAKKVRLLLTARDEDVKNACPRSRTKPKFHYMQTIHDPEAMVILKREIEEGLTEDQFSDIIQICGGIPLMLTIAAASIGDADNKEEAYARLKEQKGTKFEEMRYAFAYDTLPHECKDPFQDICTYFNGWNWNIVKDIVGDDALMKLKSRALVTRTTNGFASVHDVIIALAHGMSKEESKDKEVRRKFTNASELKKFLEEGDTEGITGIWLTERKEDGDDRKEVVVRASALDKMQKSLRVLQLGNSVKVEGNCNEIFKELCFFKANISRLPFTVSQLTQLRYLSYDPPNWVRSRLPSSLAIMNFNGKTFQTYK